MGRAATPFRGAHAPSRADFGASPKWFSCPNQECRWRGANDSTRGRVRSPDLNRNAHDLLADSRSKTSLNRISGVQLRWAHRAEPYVLALTLGDFFCGGSRAGCIL